MAKILIADDHAIVRAGLRQFIVEEPGLEVTGEAQSGTEAVELVRNQPFDVVLLDIAMPDKNGIDALRQIKQIRPDLPVLVLSTFPEEQYAVNVMRAGASGYISKEAAPTQLVAAIRTVLQGRKYVGPTLAQILAAELNGDATKPLHASLSQREFQIFCKLAAGKSVSEIGAELFLSVKTVSTYRARILDKMNLKTNADLTYYALKNGLIQ